VGSVDDETDDEYRSEERDDDADDRDGAGDDVGEAVRSAKRRFSKLWGDQVRWRLGGRSVWSHDAIVTVPRSGSGWSHRACRGSSRRMC
jgi:hypothetical protein